MSSEPTELLESKLAELQNIVSDQQDIIGQQEAALRRLDGAALTFATIINVQNYVNPLKFSDGDEIHVIDENSNLFRKTGVIVAHSDGDIVKDGKVRAKVDNAFQEWAIGVEGQDPAQVRLISGDDGTWAVISESGTNWEVRGVPDLSLDMGDCVKIHPKEKSIISKSHSYNVGPVCKVSAITDKGIEVRHRNEIHLVFNPKNFSLEEGDRVACDSNVFVIMEKLHADPRQKYKIKNDLTASWEDIGGQELAVKKLRNILELQEKHPEVWNYYKKKPACGVVLWGPPGCGKTLLARIYASVSANYHGGKGKDTAFCYVKSPEIIDKYVGNTEDEIRSRFASGRRHFQQYGYKQVLVFDEADAIVPKRGSRRSSDIADTMVPMFLGEMDGIDPEEKKTNPLVFFLTNRVSIIDPAIARDGRISHSIKVARPELGSAVDIFKIHSNDVPFENERKRDEIIALTCSDMFSKSRTLYRINQTHDFTMSDCVNGAMIENIIEIAKESAMERDINSGTMTGVSTEDFLGAINEASLKILSNNHDSDLEDFANKHQLDVNSMSVDRVFGTK